jgi:hypothetical protein
VAPVVLRERGDVVVTEDQDRVERQFKEKNQHQTTKMTEFK